MQARQLGARVGSAHRRRHPIAFIGQEARQQIANAAIIVDQQDV